MNRIPSLVATALLLLLTTACDRPAEKAPAPPSPAGGGAGADHAPTGVAPGSYEDWCAEHEVPESLCTRCDPSLIAAFQAAHDWCDEHGLPESQCRTCNPSLQIVRPPKPEGA